MKNICFVMKITKNYGGAERRFARLINFLSEDKNFTIKVIFIGISEDIDNFKGNYIKNKNIQTVKVKNPIKVLGYLINNGTDILHFVTVNTSFIFLYSLLRFFKKRYQIVLSLNSYDLCLGLYKNFLQKVTFKELIKNVNKIDCLYPSYVSNIEKVTEAMSLDIEVTCPESSFTDLEKFHPNFKKNKIIVFASRLIPQKNPILAIQAIEECSSLIRRNNYKVIFAGDGPLFNYIENYIKDHNLRDIVELTGKIDLASILPYSSIFLSLQEVENYPSQSLLEAISSGNFIIASDVGDTKRIIRKEFGLLNKLNKDDLVNSIGVAIEQTSDFNLMRNISINSRTFANQHFQISSYAEHIKKNVWEI